MDKVTLNLRLRYHDDTVLLLLIWQDLSAVTEMKYQFAHAHRSTMVNELK